MSQHEQFEEEEFDTEFNGQTVARIVRQGLLHWPLMFGYTLAMVVTSVLDGYITFLSKRIVDEGIVAGNAEQLWRLVLQYGLGLLLVALGVMCFIFSASRLGERVQYDLRKKMFARLQDLSLSYYDRTPVGWLMSRLTSDASRVGDLVSWGVMDLAWGAASIVVSLYFMAKINVQMMLIVAAVIPVLVVVAFRFKKKILVEYRDVRKTNSKITGAYNENITGVRVVKSLRREEGNLEEFTDLTRTMYRAGYRAAWLSALFLPVVQLITARGGFQHCPVRRQAVPTGRHDHWRYSQAFIFYITHMMFPIQEMARIYAEMQQAIASGERIFSLVDAVPEVQDRSGAEAPDSLRGEIVFENVEFQYEEEKPVLRDFSLHVKPGRDDCSGRADRCGQVDDCQPGLPLLRAVKRPYSDQWQGLYGVDAAWHSQPYRRCVADSVSLFRLGLGESPLRTARRNRRGGRACGQDCRGPRLYRGTGRRV